MTTFDRIEPRLPELMTELAGAAVPSYFDEMLEQTGRARQRSAWASIERWLPMKVEAGHGTIAIWAAFLVAAIVGASLLTVGLLASQRPTPKTPSLPGVAPAPTSSRTPAATPTPSAEPSPIACRPPADALHLDLEKPLGPLVSAHCSIWAIRWSDGAVLRIDPSTGATVATIRLADPVSSLTSSGGDLWATGRVTVSGRPVAQGFIARIDPDTDAAAGTVTAPVDGDPTFRSRTIGTYVDIVSGLGFLHPKMVSNPPIRQTVIDLATGAVRGMIADGTVVGVGSTILVVSSSTADGSIGISKLEPSTLKTTLIRHDPNVASWSWSAGQEALIATNLRDEVVSISPATGEQTPTSLQFSAGERIQQAAAGSMTVFLRGVQINVPGDPKGGGEETREVVILDNATGRVVDRIAFVLRNPVGLWAGDGRAWILSSDGTVRSVPLPAG